MVFIETDGLGDVLSDARTVARQHDAFFYAAFAQIRYGVFGIAFDFVADRYATEVLIVFGDIDERSELRRWHI